MIKLKVNGKDQAVEVPPDMPLLDKLRAHYRGIRVSFGYPACPDLADQRVLFDLLRPEQIGLGLTEGFMMDPEASVSAMIFHHPDAVYFGVGGDQPADTASAAV